VWGRKLGVTGSAVNKIVASYSPGTRRLRSIGDDDLVMDVGEQNGGMAAATPVPWP
jgi:hypothetical protein